MSLFKFFSRKKDLAQNIKILEPEIFLAKIKGKDVQLVDVRTPREFLSGHLDRAININFFSGKFNIDFNKLDKTKPVFVYCRSGNRSLKSAKRLAKMDFKEIYDLKGGVLSLKN